MGKYIRCIIGTTVQVKILAIKYLQEIYFFGEFYSGSNIRLKRWFHQMEYHWDSRASKFLLLGVPFMDMDLCSQYGKTKRSYDEPN